MLPKNVKLQVFVDAKLYEDMKNYIKEHKFINNDSQMVYFIIKKQLYDTQDIQMTVYTMRKQIENQKEIIAKYIEQVNFLKGELTKKQNRKIKKVK